MAAGETAAGATSAVENISKYRSAARRRSVSRTWFHISTVNIWSTPIKTSMQVHPGSHRRAGGEAQKSLQVVGQGLAASTDGRFSTGRTCAVPYIDDFSYPGRGGATDFCQGWQAKAGGLFIRRPLRPWGLLNFFFCNLSKSSISTV